MVPHDNLTDVKLTVYLPKPFTTESIPAFIAAAPFFSKLRQSILVRLWPRLHAAIKTGFLSTHVELLAHRLEAADPGLVAFLDQQVDTVRSASRVLPNFKDRVLFAKAPLGDIQSYMYWKYSRDVLGKPAGLTKTALERQLGLCYFYVAVPFKFPCPNCCADAECEADGVGQTVPGHVRMHCRACGHIDQHNAYGDNEVGSYVLCRCSYCIAETRRTGAELERLQWDLVPQLITYVRTQIASIRLRAATTEGGDADTLSKVRDFAAQWTAGGVDDFASALTAWVKHRNRGLLYPQAYLDQVWTLIGALVSTEAVSMEVVGAADDDQDILEWIALDGATQSTDEERRQCSEREQLDALAVVLKGFKLDQPGSLPGWLRAVGKIGLFDSWFKLPCDIECRLDPRRMIDAQSATSKPAPGVQAAITLLLANGYWVTAPS